MLKSFIRSVLSTPKQRQRFIYFRNGTAAMTGFTTFFFFGAGIAGGIFGVIAILLAYVTIAPIIAFLICLFEQMAS